MILIVEKEEGILKKIKAEYTPAEALIINHAMRRYAKDEDVSEVDRIMMKQMLSVEPVEEEGEV